jgi:hypothetical protein
MTIQQRVEREEVEKDKNENKKETRGIQKKRRSKKRLPG